MSKIILSICSRLNKESKSLSSIKDYVNKAPSHIDMRIAVAYDAPSIYQGHTQNLDWTTLDTKLEDDDIIVMCHDDIQIMTNHHEFESYLKLCLKPNVGFLGVAGSTYFDMEKINGAWWSSRNFGATRGFVFQGNDHVFMAPNYFGPYGQVVVLDGCFIACSYKTLKLMGLHQPSYLSGPWDFYDIHLTFKAHRMGYSNFTVPIIIRHESPGEMRKDWYKARDEFVKFFRNELPVTLPHNKTHGLPN